MNNSVTMVGVVAALGFVTMFVVPTSGEGLSVDIRPVGCFRDRKCQEGQPMPELVKNFRDPDVLNWSDIYNSVIKPCALAVKERGYLWFGIEYYGECWSGEHAHETYNMDGTSSECWFEEGVGKANTLFVYKIRVPECENYKNITDATRSMSYVTGPSSAKCDSVNGEIKDNEWYRLVKPAGTIIPTHCTKTAHCDTNLSGWMKGALPSIQEGIVNRNVFFSESKDGITGNCEKFSSQVEVRNCGSYYVYKLPYTPACLLRYCGNGGGGDGIVDAPECKTYINITDETRSMHYKAQGSAQCDMYSGIKEDKWYRLVKPAGIIIPTKCTRVQYCNTYRSGWMQGTLPEVSEGIVPRKVSFSVSNDGVTGNCDASSSQIKVRNCGLFYVYQLSYPSNCLSRYCGNGVEGDDDDDDDDGDDDDVGGKDDWTKTRWSRQDQD